MSQHAEKQAPAPVPEFATTSEAMHWMVGEVDDPCIDNYRIAFTDSESEVGKYERLRNGGCCGFFDREVKISGRIAMVGCNYGH